MSDFRLIDVDDVELLLTLARKALDRRGDHEHKAGHDGRCCYCGKS